MMSRYKGQESAYEHKNLWKDPPACSPYLHDGKARSNSANSLSKQGWTKVWRLNGKNSYFLIVYKHKKDRIFKWKMCNGQSTVPLTTDILFSQPDSWKPANKRFWNILNFRRDVLEIFKFICHLLKCSYFSIKGRIFEPGLTNLWKAQRNINVHCPGYKI